ncbi:TetR/AcrR family transcriptional regulator, partial [Brachybacterium tyrofermentans]|uniref:TetR/AcrR family transcriptional regulator n=1 Tax=Brachybacterium tyrofermentans TaxID=47848 RepID=UPI003FD259AA
SLYRHFPSKRALLTAIVQQRFQGMAKLARSAEEIADPWDAFTSVLIRYLEAAETDKAFQWAMLGSDAVDWDGIKGDKDEFAAIVTRVIACAVAAGAVRPDLTYADFPVMTCGIMSTMYFQPGGNADWRRHLALLIDGLQPRQDPQPAYD